MTITDAMVEAAADAYLIHDPRTWQAEGAGRWHWFCSCGAGRDEIDATDEQTAEREVRLHEFRPVIAAALEWLPPPITTWDQLWCAACGNRYDAERVTEKVCSCGDRLAPVTLQMVTREAS